MTKGFIGSKQLKRFVRIRKFTRKYSRIPTNKEVSKMFKVSIGETSSDILKKYKSTIGNCLLCGHKL